MRTPRKTESYDQCTMPRGAQGNVESLGTAVQCHFAEVRNENAHKVMMPVLQNTPANGTHSNTPAAGRGMGSGHQRTTVPQNVDLS